MGENLDFHHRGPKVSGTHTGRRRVGQVDEKRRVVLLDRFIWPHVDSSLAGLGERRNLAPSTLRKMRTLGLIEIRTMQLESAKYRRRK